MTTRHPPRGFTLLECAISIAMIAVLLAILLPALNAGRAASRRTACADHLRHLGVAIDQIVEEAGEFPGVYSEAGWRWGGVRFSRAMGRAYIDFDRPLNPHLALMMPTDRLEQLFLCPADAGIRGDLETTGTGTRTAFEAYGTSYRANDRLFDARQAGVRRAAGKQAMVLNQILDDVSHHKKVKAQKLRELLGHSPVEVFAGIALGILVASFFLS